MISALATVVFAAPTVTSVANSGPGTLRAALDGASPGDTIVFDPVVFPVGVVRTIEVGSTLTIADAGLVLDAGGRVELACAAAMTSGSGLAVTADQVLVAGMQVRDCPDHGVLVSAAQFVVTRMVVRANDKFGILVNGGPTVTWGGSVSDNDVANNCAATTATCAGIGVRRGGGTGPGPLDVTVSGNDVDNQASGGHGIAVLGGDDIDVVDNRVGLLAGNAGHGLVCTAQTGLTAQGRFLRNVVVDNLGAGIQLGARCLPTVVGDNLVGTNGVAALGNGLAGIEVFGSDGHTVRDNVIAANVGAGITVNGLVSGSPAEDVVIEDNLVGLAADGEAALGNGGDGLVLAGGALPGRHLVRRNTFAANGGDGIEIAVRDVTLAGNAIGTNTRVIDGLGNAGHGVRIAADGDGTRIESFANQAVLTPTLVYGNAGDGVNVLGDSVVVLGAHIGRNGDDGVDASRPGFELRESRVLQNLGRGVHLAGTASDAVIADDELAGSGTTGLTVDANADRVEWSRNRVHHNGTCGMSIHTTVNDAPGQARPVVVDATATRIGGTYVTPAGRTVERIELFADDGTEFGRYLGNATLGISTWEWRPAHEEALVDPAHRISAFAVFDDGSASLPEAWCGDGCSGAGGSCNDGNPCTSDTCNGTTCTHGVANQNGTCNDGDDCTLTDRCTQGACVGPIANTAGTACLDEDACTPASTCDASGHCVAVDLPGDPADDPTAKCELRAGEPCTAQRGECTPTLGCSDIGARDEGFACEAGRDACRIGDTCDLFADCREGEPLAACPEAGPGRACTCDPDQGCVCEAIVGDGCCTAWELSTDASGALLSPDCLRDGEQPAAWDDDGDGFPNLWEVNRFVDADCDGIQDPAEFVPFTQGMQDVFWELDVQAPRGGHDHFVSGDVLDDVSDAYALGEKAVTIDTSGQFPHDFTVATFGPNPPQTGSPDWRSLGQLERDHFTPARFGVYHYAVHAHRINEAWQTGNPGVGGAAGMVLAFVDETELEQAGVFFHESGHTLGLGHGPDRTNKNLNHPSAMSYRHRRLFDVRLGEWVYDWSHVDLRDVDEGALSENDTFFVDPTDTDGDGWPDAVDCFPNLAGRHPCADDPAGDGVDRDCANGDAPRTDECGSPPVYDPDDPLYLVFWECAPLTSGDEPWEYWTPPHADAATTAAARRMDLNCDGVAGNGGVFANARLDGKGGPPELHRGNDDWAEMEANLPFQSSPSFLGPRRYEAEEEDYADEAPRPVIADGVLYPACATKNIPTAAGYLVPVVVYGVDGELDAGTLTRARLNGADAWLQPFGNRFRLDWDQDGVDDLYVRFRTADLTGLAATATRATVWADGVPSDATFHTPIGRVTAPADADGDGLHDACDACDATPPGAFVGPDGCSTPAVPW